MGVEALVAHNPSSTQNSKTPALPQSVSAPDATENPWHEGDPHREDALPEPHHGNGRELTSKGYLKSMFQSLPQRLMAQLLLERYFSTVNPIWPLLLENKSRNLFSRTWESEEPLDPVWIAHLNLDFCLACQSYNGNLDGKSPLDVLSRLRSTQSV